jgi:acetyltransferase-like isoleucine patch superfamily enzyme
MNGVGVVLGEDVVLSKNVEVWNYTRIGDESFIGESSKIGSFCDIGCNVYVGHHCLVQCHVTISNGCDIGDHVFIGPNVSLLNDKYIRDVPVIEPVVLENYVKIGGGTVILPRVTVGHHSFVGAGARIVKDIPAYSIVYTKAEGVYKKKDG